MKVSELIDVLNDMDPEAEVVLQADAEGNDYQLLRCYEGGLVFADDKYDRSVKYRKLTPELEECGYNEEDVWDGVEDVVDCVVLSP